MAPTPVRHPLRDDLARRRAIAAHPAGRGRSRALVRARARLLVAPAPVPVAATGVTRPTAAPVDAGHHDEAGSITTEYGLVVVVGATICSLVIKWASGGAVFDLLGGVLQAAKGLVGF